MLFRRIAEHLRTQNWLAVFLDLLIVIVGIFIGLQVNDWNERRLEERLADQTLQRLRADFVVIHDEADRFGGEHRDNAAALDELVQAIRGENGDVDPETIRFALRNALKYAPSARRSTTWVELLSSGRTGLVRDSELRALMSQYDESHQAAQSLFAQFWEGQRVHEVVFGRHFSYTAARERFGDVIVDADVESWDLEAMAADPEFIYAAQRLLEYQIYFQYWHGRMRTTVEDILERLPAPNSPGATTLTE